MISKLRPELFQSERLRNALAWLQEHLKAPLEGLDVQPEELHGDVVRLKAIAEEEFGENAPALEVSRLMLELSWIDRELSGFTGEGEGTSKRAMELQKLRAQTAELVREGRG